MFFEILDKQTLKTENGLKFTFGMTVSEVAKLLKGYEYSYSKTYLIYPQKRKELEETFEYKNLGKLDKIGISEEQLEYFKLSKNVYISPKYGYNNYKLQPAEISADKVKYIYMNNYEDKLKELLELEVKK